MHVGTPRHHTSYFGEHYDASLEQPGWATPGFQPAPSFEWAPAGAIDYSPTPPWMMSQLMQPIRKVDEVEPYSCMPVLAHPGIGLCVCVFVRVFVFVQMRTDARRKHRNACLGSIVHQFY